MRSSSLFVLLVVASIVASLPLCANPVYAPPAPPLFLTVAINKHLFVGNETITIWGNATLNSHPGQAVVIQIYNSNQTDVATYTTKLSANESYSYHFFSGILGKAPDTYGVTVTYGGLEFGTYFYYIPGPYPLQAEGRTYPLNYTLDTGRLSGHLPQPIGYVHISNDC